MHVKEPAKCKKLHSSCTAEAPEYEKSEINIYLVICVINKWHDNQAVSFSSFTEPGNLPLPKRVSCWKSSANTRNYLDKGRNSAMTILFKLLVLGKRKKKAVSFGVLAGRSCKLMEGKKIGKYMIFQMYSSQIVSCIWKMFLVTLIQTSIKEKNIPKTM